MLRLRDFTSNPSNFCMISQVFSTSRFGQKYLLGFISSIIVLCLFLVPFLLEVVEAKSLIIHIAWEEEIAVSDSIINWFASGVPHGIWIGRKFGALEQETSYVWVFSENVLAKFNHAGRDFFSVNFPSSSDGIEAGNILSTSNSESLLLSVNTTFNPNQTSHWCESCFVGSNDSELLSLVISTCNSWKLGQSRHEDWQFGVLSSEFLEVHHKSTIASDSVYFAFRVKPFNGLDKPLFDLWCELTGLAHLKRESGDHSVEDLIAKTVRVINISRSWWVVIFQSDDAKPNGMFFIFNIFSRFFSFWTFRLRFFLWIFL